MGRPYAVFRAHSRENPSLTRSVRSTLALPGLVYAGPRRGEPDAGGERPGRLEVARRTGVHEVVKNLVRHRLVEDAPVAEGLEVQLERLQLDAQPVRGVPKRDGPEVRVAGLRADAGELRADDLDGVVA